MARRFSQPTQGLQGGYTDPFNLSHQGADEAGDFYRNADSLNQAPGMPPPSVLEQSVHMGQRAQAQDYSDTQGFKGLMQALHERNAVVPLRGGGLDLPDSPVGQPSTIFDPARQTSAVDGEQPHRAALDKIHNPQYYGGVADPRKATNPALDALKRAF